LGIILLKYYANKFRILKRVRLSGRFTIHTLD